MLQHITNRLHQIRVFENQRVFLVCRSKRQSITKETFDELDLINLPVLFHQGTNLFQRAGIRSFCVFHDRPAGDVMNRLKRFRQSFERIENDHASPDIAGRYRNGSRG